MAKDAKAAKAPPKDAAPAAEETEVEEPLVASELDERTHAEMLALYHEAMETSRHGKAQQWRSMAIGLFAIVALGVLGAHVPKADMLFRIAQFLTVLIGLSAIYLIVFYQFWQNTEREKLRRITAKFSNLARTVRAVSSGREASLRRFVVLGFMVLMIVATVALTLEYLAQLPDAPNY
ncbi:MAG TPA: hypothetical protein VHA35_19795 [Dongiaceae bacterium]|jgi:hypothetical protein|nr:hypothetical protein [Dongiaceae bacterium]